MATTPSSTLNPSSPAILWRRMWASLAGMMFGGQRDLYKIFGYDRILTYDKLRDRYIRQDITKRVVDAPVNAVWDFPPEFDDVTASDLKVWKDFQDRLDIFQAFARVDKLCAFGRFSLLLMGLPGKLHTPAPNGLSGSDLLYLQPYGEKDVSIQTYEADENSPRFGFPLTYSIKLLQGEAQTITKIVHWTRVVHVVDNPMENDLIATPRLEHVNNVLDDILKVAGGSAELFWILANRGMQVDIDKDMELTTADEKALTAELDEYSHELRRYVRTRGVKITQLGSDIADPTGTFSTLVGLLASATGIPQRILMGAEAGQLASEQDRANWAEIVQQRRIHFAEPSVLKPFIRRMQDVGVLGTRMPSFDWPDAFHQNPLERAQSMAQFARAAVNLSRQNQLFNPITSMEEARISMGLDPQMKKGDTVFKDPPAPVVAAPLAGKKNKAGDDGGDPTKAAGPDAIPAANSQ